MRQNYHFIGILSGKENRTVFFKIIQKSPTIPFFPPKCSKNLLMLLRSSFLCLGLYFHNSAFFFCFVFVFFFLHNPVSIFHSSAFFFLVFFFFFAQSGFFFPQLRFFLTISFFSFHFLENGVPSDDPFFIKGTITTRTCSLLFVVFLGRYHSLLVLTELTKSKFTQRQQTIHYIITIIAKKNTSRCFVGRCRYIIGNEFN